MSKNLYEKHTRKHVPKKEQTLQERENKSRPFEDI